MNRPNIITPTKNLEDAITAEAHDWAEFFEVSGVADLEARKLLKGKNGHVKQFGNPLTASRAIETAAREA